MRNVLQGWKSVWLVWMGGTNAALYDIVHFAPEYRIHLIGALVKVNVRKIAYLSQSNTCFAYKRAKHTNQQWLWLSSLLLHSYETGEKMRWAWNSLELHFCEPMTWSHVQSFRSLNIVNQIRIRIFEWCFRYWARFSMFWIHEIHCTFFPLCDLDCWHRETFQLLWKIRLKIVQSKIGSGCNATKFLIS